MKKIVLAVGVVLMSAGLVLAAGKTITNETVARQEWSPSEKRWCLIRVAAGYAATDLPPVKVVDRTEIVCGLLQEEVE